MSGPFSLRQASRRWWVLLGVLAVAFGAVYFGRRAPAAATTRLEGRTMGTTWSVLLDGPRPSGREEALRGEVEALLAEVNASMSTYDPNSELSRFNRVRDTAPVEISAPLAEVMALSLDVSRRSGGSFDVTVGPLVEAWGFGSRGRVEELPEDDEIARLLSRVGADQLVLQGRALAKRHPEVEVDLSAVAKGDAVDRVSELLLARGEPNHLVEIGGELRARGQSAQGVPFRVGIEEPDPRQRTLRLAVALDDRALASSGNYRNHFTRGGRRYAHTLDPRTGRPVQHPLQAVSVLHDRCGAADAWATALLAAGPEQAWELANAEGLDVLLLVEGPEGKVVQRVTPGFERALLPVPSSLERR
ncbi:MAG: FAD:protein FMN transferase [Myxococcota bacterium]|nr:FAD:protein FMN transferase [Myxococcota bacterium]